MPKAHAQLVRNVLSQLRGIVALRPYKFDAILYLVFLRSMQMMYRIRRCGNGKSIVQYGLATMRWGVHVTRVPLIGLGNNEGAKSECPDAGVQSYHFNEFRDGDAGRLDEYLGKNDLDNTAVLVYILLQKLRPYTKGDKWNRWHTLFQRLARKGQIALFCVDEVHTMVENSDLFHPEFKDGVQSIRDLIAYLNNHNHDVHIPLLPKVEAHELPFLFHILVLSSAVSFSSCFRRSCFFPCAFSDTSSL